MKRSSIRLIGSSLDGRSRRHPRSGAILIFAMLALLVMSMLGASLVRTSLASLRQLHREQQRLQADWLADAGCQRAVLQLQTDVGFVGEHWHVPADQLPSSLTGVVHIAVAADPKSESNRTVTVVAEYPQEGVCRNRVTRQLTVSLTKSETN